MRDAQKSLHVLILNYLSEEIAEFKTNYELAKLKN